MDKTKIILIEDDKILAKVIFEELRKADFNVIQVFDGNKALKIIRAEKPDLILLDIILPEKPGFEILEELKKSPDTKDIPVIIMSMLSNVEDIKKGLRLGADDYFVKSQHTVAEIIEKVRKFFAHEQKPRAKRIKKDIS